MKNASQGRDFPITKIGGVLHLQTFCHWFFVFSLGGDKGPTPGLRRADTWLGVRSGGGAVSMAVGALLVLTTGITPQPFAAGRDTRLWVWSRGGCVPSTFVLGLGWEGGQWWLADTHIQGNTSASQWAGGCGLGRHGLRCMRVQGGGGGGGGYPRWAFVVEALPPVLATPPSVAVRPVPPPQCSSLRGFGTAGSGCRWWRVQRASPDPARPCVPFAEVTWAFPVGLRVYAPGRWPPAV